jgi:3-hydroxybutyryl-CoA dehydrogenase
MSVNEVPPVRQVGVVGFGQMGSGIVQLGAQAGFETIVRDVSADVLTKGLAGIERQLDKLVDKEKILAADRSATLARIRTTTDLADLAKCDLVVEAIVEDPPK